MTYIPDIDRVFSQLMNRINRYEKQQRHHGHRTLWQYWAIAASVLLFLLAGYHLYTTSNPPENKMLVLTGGNEGREQYTLPDGTTVCLNRGSKLIYPTRFSGKQREVCLSGQAFFDVAKEPNRMFIVKTGKIDIQVTGTQFDVTAYDVDDEIITSLVSGSVQISMEDEATGRIALKPGERLIHNKQHQSTTIYKDVDMDVYTSWKDGYLRFKESSFQEVRVQLEHAYGVRIQLKDKFLTERKYTGRLDLRNSIEDILETIKTTTPMNYTILGKDVTITN